MLLICELSDWVVWHDQLSHHMKHSFLICDKVIWDDLSYYFCAKSYHFDRQRDFEKELIQNSFKDSLITTKNRMSRMWNCAKWKCPRHVNIVYLSNSMKTTATIVVSVVVWHSCVCYHNEKYQRYFARVWSWKRNQFTDQQLWFYYDMGDWSFHFDGDLCNEFQKDKRNQNCGCKWSRMDTLLFQGLQCLQFVQKMVHQCPKISCHNRNS